MHPCKSFFFEIYIIIVCEFLSTRATVARYFRKCISSVRLILLRIYIVFGYEGNYRIVCLMSPWCLMLLSVECLRKSMGGDFSRQLPSMLRLGIGGGGGIKVN